MAILGLMPRDVPPPPREDVVAIGRRLKLVREVLGFRDEDERQGEFALNAGINANTYNQWERGKGRPNLDYALKLVRKYPMVTLDYIYLGKTDGMPSQFMLQLESERTCRVAAATPDFAFAVRQPKRTRSKQPA